MSKVNLNLNIKEDVKIQQPKKFTKNKNVQKKSIKRRRSDNAILDDIQMDTSYKFEKQEIEDLHHQLLEWYDKNHRILPWRRNLKSQIKKSQISQTNELDDQKFAYYVYISEMMLQQTQVTTVIDYFNQWIEKWPDIKSLSKATEEEVRDMWSGLGYYNRACNILKTSKYIMDNCNGIIPMEPNDLIKLKGIGPYSSRAIASIAFNKACAVVDGNVVRVLSRLKSIVETTHQSKDIIDYLSNSIINENRPGDFNQALMELGAMICKPSNPNCEECPINSLCTAFQNHHVNNDGNIDKYHEVTYFPVIEKKIKRRKENVFVSVIGFMIDSNNKENMIELLMVKRNEKGLLANMWEFPTVPINDLNEKILSMNNYYKEIFDMDLNKFKILKRNDVGFVKHQFTHIDMTLNIEYIIISIKNEIKDLIQSESKEIKWIKLNEMQNIKLCRMVDKVWKMVKNKIKF